jgi:hypothetical protein
VGGDGLRGARVAQELYVVSLATGLAGRQIFELVCHFNSPLASLVA